MPRATVNGIDLYFEVHGEGPPIVFAHGVGGNHASWFQQVPYFSRWHTVVTFDHRGFGNSHEVPEGPGRAAFVDDLRGLLDHLGFERATLVAQSMGGWSCLGFALRHPDRTSALVMADTLGGISAPGPLAERLEQVREATQNLPQLDRVICGSFRQRHPDLSHLYLQIASFNAVDRSNIRGSSGEAVTPERLAKLDVPVLFLVGQEDVLVPPDVARMAHKLVPGSSYVVVPDAGHSVYFEQPDVFNQQVYSFLKNSAR